MKQPGVSSDNYQFRAYLSAGQAQRVQRGVRLQLDGEFLALEAIRDDIVRLKLSRGGVFDDKPTTAVVADLAEPPELTVSDDGNAVQLCTKRLSVRAQREPFRIDIFRSDGSSVLRSCDVAECGLPTLAVRGCGTPQDRGAFFAPMGSQEMAGDDARVECDPYEFLVARRYRPDDAIYGLGQKTGGLNRRGRDYRLWNTDILGLQPKGDADARQGPVDPVKDPTSTCFDPYYISIPFFCHLESATGNAAGFFVDNGYEGRFAFSAGDHYWFRCAGGQYTEYVFAGPKLGDILEAYSWLTGRVQLPPVWALGHHQCRWHAYDEDAVLQLANRYREKGIPCDSLWLDIDYMEGFRVFTWDLRRFPAPSRLLERLGEQGYRAITIVDPGVKVEEGYRVFDEGLAGDFFCRTATKDLYIGQVWPGDTAFPDFVRPEVCTWWADQVAHHLKSGVAGIWIDMNEPATGDVDERGMRFHLGRYPHERFHNQYALLMARATHEGIQKAKRSERPFVLSRAGSAGIQRFCANWLGDNCSRWEHLWMSMPMAMGLGLSGQPFVGADVGGFAEDTSGELLTRWYQHGALSPFFRNHTSRGTVEQYPWSFGLRVEAACRDAVRLRYRLLPYLYAAFHCASATGEPIQVPMIFAFQYDPRVRDIDDQYLLGRHLLAAPVFGEGAKGRQVYLPEGNWYDWHSGTSIRGPKTVHRRAPLSRVPLFVRGGAVIPTLPSAPSTTMGLRSETIELQVFVPAQDGETRSLLYEDDGWSLDYREGAYLLTTILLRRHRRDLSISASVSGRGYPEHRRRVLELVFHDAIDQVLVNGRVPVRQNGRVVTENTGSGFEVVATLGGARRETRLR